MTLSGRKTVYQTDLKYKMESNSKPQGAWETKVAYCFWQAKGQLVRPWSPLADSADKLSLKHVCRTKHNHYFHWQNVSLPVLGSLSILSVI